MSTPLTPATDDAVRSYVIRISTAYHKSAEAYLAAGKLLLAAKAELKHGQWLAVLRDLPFGETQAQNLMRIAENPLFSDPRYIGNLPPSWATMYELDRLGPERAKAAFANGAITRSMTRAEARALATGTSTPAPPFKRAATTISKLCMYAETLTTEEMAATAQALPSPAYLRGLSTWLSELAVECANVHGDADPDSHGFTVFSREYLDQAAQEDPEFAQWLAEERASRKL